MHRITRPRLIVPTLLVALALLLGAPLPHDARAQSPDGPAVPAYSNRDAAVTILGPPSVDTSFAEINFGGSSELPAQILIIPGIGVVYGDPLASGGAIGGGMMALLRLAEPFDFNPAAALQPAQISTASLGGALHTADHFDGWPEPPTTANSSDARPEDATRGTRGNPVGTNPQVTDANRDGKPEIGDSKTGGVYKNSELFKEIIAAFLLTTFLVPGANPYEGVDREPVGPFTDSGIALIARALEFETFIESLSEDLTFFDNLARNPPTFFDANDPNAGPVPSADIVQPVSPSDGATTETGTNGDDPFAGGATRPACPPGSLLNANGDCVDEDGPVDSDCPDGFARNRFDVCVDASGNVVDEDAVCPANARLTADGRCIDEDGNSVDEFGRDLDEDGRLVCPPGFMRNPGGICVNENNETSDVDIICPEDATLLADGACVDEDGNVVDPVDDEDVDGDDETDCPEGQTADGRGGCVPIAPSFASVDQPLIDGNVGVAQTPGAGVPGDALLQGDGAAQLQALVDSGDFAVALNSLRADTTPAEEPPGTPTFTIVPAPDELFGVLGGTDPLTLSLLASSRPGAVIVYADVLAEGERSFVPFRVILSSDPTFGQSFGFYTADAPGGDLGAAQAGAACTGACLWVSAPAAEAGQDSRIYLIDLAAMPGGSFVGLTGDEPWVQVISGIPNGQRGIAADMHDLNGDGLPDLVIGVPAGSAGDLTGDPTDSDASGVAYALQGPLTGGDVRDFVVRLFHAVTPDERFGGDVDIADLNFDGLLDIGITSRRHPVEGRRRGGAAFIWTGLAPVITGLERSGGSLAIEGVNLDAAVLLDGVPALVTDASATAVTVLGDFDSTVEVRGLWFGFRVRQGRVVELGSGFNLVGWTGATPVEEALASIDGSFTGVFTWNPATDSFDSFSPDAPAFINTLEELNLGDGLWINIDDPNGATWIQPPFTDARSVDLVAGLQLAVWTGPDGTPIQDALGGILGATVQLLVWDPLAGVFRSFNTNLPAALNTLAGLDFGTAFWIEVSEPVTWNQPPR